MKKFAFTMEGVLNVRMALRESRELELAKARRALAEAIEKLETVKATIEKALSQEAVEKAVDGYFFVQRERYLKKLREEAKAQARKVNEAEAAVAIALEKLKEAIAEVKKLDRQKDRQRERWSVDFKHDEQKTNDEIATIRSHARMQVGAYE